MARQKARRREAGACGLWLVDYGPSAAKESSDDTGGDAAGQVGGGEGRASQIGGLAKLVAAGEGEGVGDGQGEGDGWRSVSEIGRERLRERDWEGERAYRAAAATVC